MKDIINVVKCIAAVGFYLILRVKYALIGKEKPVLTFTDTESNVTYVF